MGGVSVTCRTYTVAEVSELSGLSSWSVYAHLKDKSFPVAPIRVGARILFSRVLIDAAFPIERVS